MENNKIKVKTEFFCKNSKKEIVSIIANSQGITSAALERLTGSDSKKTVALMAKSDFLNVEVNNLFSKKKGRVLFVQKKDIQSIYNNNSLSYIPYFFRKAGFILSPVSLEGGALSFSIFSPSGKTYANFIASLSDEYCREKKSENKILFEPNRQVFLEKVQQKEPFESRIIMSIFEKNNETYISGYVSAGKNNEIKNIDTENLFENIDTLPVLDPAFFLAAKKRYLTETGRTNSDYK